MVLPTSAVVFLLLHSVAVVEGRWQLLCCSSFFSVVFPFSPLFSVLPLCFLFFPPSPKFCPPHLVSSPLVFIGKRRESPHCLVPSWRRRETRLPYLCRVRWSAVCRAWCPFLGRVWLCGYGFGKVLCKWEGEKVSGKKILKAFFSPVSAFAGEKNIHSAV